MGGYVDDYVLNLAQTYNQGHLYALGESESEGESEGEGFNESDSDADL